MKEIKIYVNEKLNTLKDYISTNNLKIKTVVIQVGDNPASNAYVRGKVSDAAKVGIECEVRHFPESISERDLLMEVTKCNTDPSIDGFIVQLPLPKHISEQKIIDAIDYRKDIDGFSPLNKKCDAATPKGIMMYLTDQGFDFDGKNAVILGRSNIVGKPMHKLLLNKNMNVTILHTHTWEEDKRFYLAHADLIIVATGHRNTITTDYKLKPTAVLMDVGINRNSENKLCGDVEQELPIAFKSKVPGGCGLLTRLALLQNIVDLTVSSNDYCTVHTNK